MSGGLLSRGTDALSLPRLGARPTFVSERYAPWLDRGLVLVILLLSLPSLVRANGSEPVPVTAFSLALGIPLLWRRRAPLVVFSLIAAVAFVQWLAFRPATADAALLVGLYTIAARETRGSRILAAAAVVELGAVLVLTPGHGESPSRNVTAGLIMLSGLVVAAVVLGLNVRMRAAYVAQMEDRARRLELERDQQAQLATAAERTRIARDLHDIVAHNLSVMIALADGAALSLDTRPEEARRALTEAATSGRRAMADLRQVLGVLRGHGDDPELAPTPTLLDLDDLVRATRDTGLRVDVSYAGDARSLPAPLQLSLFRIIQESVTNAIKHAEGSTRVAVDVRVDADAVCVSVSDDGRPSAVPAAQADTGAGHGLTGMRERAALHQGSLVAGPTATGWTVHATLPSRTERYAG